MSSLPSRCDSLGDFVALLRNRFDPVTPNPGAAQEHTTAHSDRFDQHGKGHKGGSSPPPKQKVPSGQGSETPQSQSQPPHPDKWPRMPPFPDNLSRKASAAPNSSYPSAFAFDHPDIFSFLNRNAFDLQKEDDGLYTLISDPLFTPGRHRLDRRGLWRWDVVSSEWQLLQPFTRNEFAQLTIPVKNLVQKPITWDFDDEE